MHVVMNLYVMLMSTSVPLRSSLPNTEQSGSVPRIRDGTAPFYLAPQPNTTLNLLLC
jgi:hypothetical protein